MADIMPECRKHGDCFANRGGRCVCLKNNDFNGRDCPFYKPADTGREDRRRGKEEGAFYGTRKV